MKCSSCGDEYDLDEVLEYLEANGVREYYNPEFDDTCASCASSDISSGLGEWEEIVEMSPFLLDD